jgi:hypothetical protein
MAARPPRRTRASAVLFGVLSLIVMLGVALGVPALRHSLLRTAGWTLVSDDAEQHVDSIVVAVAADGAGVLEAADLVHRGVSPRVAVFSEPTEVWSREFIRRRAPYYNESELSVQQLHALGVSSVDVIPERVGGTHDEGNALPPWCASMGYRSILVVSTTDHSRRVRRIVGRGMRGAGVRVLVRYSRYSSFDPNNWWETEDGFRTGLVELEKLLIDIVRHPFA